MSGNAKSKQLLVMPTKSLTNREWLSGELLSGSKCQRPSWFLDMKYQTCLILFMSFFSIRYMLELKFVIYHRAASLSL